MRFTQWAFLKSGYVKNARAEKRAMFYSDAFVDGYVEFRVQIGKPQAFALVQFAAHARHQRAVFSRRWERTAVSSMKPKP